ncbi:MAG: holo-ACP synthase [Lachnospiraceae bacterium]|nr:holo-ACP synthase [Lachnospiraceae bacterium]MDY5742152.1 holo-ACP synthase [Lachnospiraceae bacterium]
MIIGVGIDLIEINRIEKACHREAFLFRVYSDRERQLIAGCARRAAGNFAAKEAFAKVLGTGFRGFLPNEVEVLRDELGKPYYHLSGEAARLAGMAGISRLHLSITNTRELAGAYAVGENDKES